MSSIHCASQRQAVVGFCCFARLRAGRLWKQEFDSWHEQQHFFFRLQSLLAGAGAHPLPCSSSNEAFLLPAGIKRPGREADRSPPSDDAVTNM
jgi:hypothetical protein